MAQVLALRDLGEGEDGASVVLCGCVIIQKEIQVEKAGRSFFDRYEKLKASPDASPEPSEGVSDAENDRFCRSPESPEKDKKTKKPRRERDNALKLNEILKGEDLYKLLQCDSACSQDDLKKAHKRLCLLHHPDKNSQDKSEEEMEEINRTFLKLQEAYDLLSDLKKRRKYDSLGDFDDSIPSGLKPGQDFFSVFGEVFRRNAKWSETKPVPELGNISTSYDRVERFYDFWRGFQSWRDLDEKIIEEEGDDVFQNLEDAECREERRWMEQENARIRKKYAKVERQRIWKLVETAEKLDPRVKAEKDRIWAAREAEKAKKDAKRIEAERLAREEAELQRVLEQQKEEERRMEKAKKEEERNARKSVRAALRKRVSSMQLGLAENQLQEFFLTLEVEEIHSLSESLSEDPQPQKVFDAMRAKQFEPIILQKQEDERSTAEGSSHEEEEVLSPEKQQELAKLAAEQEVQRKKREEANKLRAIQLEQERQARADQLSEEKAQRDAKKKQEQQKREAERRKQEKKEAERIKKEMDRQQKESHKLAAEQEAQRKKLEEANKLRAAQVEKERELEAQQREEDAKQLLLENDRRERADQFEQLEWSQVVEAAQNAGKSQDKSGLLKAALNRQGEDKADALLACLGSHFILGVRPSQSSPVLSSALRNRIKKIRNRLRQAIAAGEFGEFTASGKADEAALTKLLSEVVNGEVSAPVVPVLAPNDSPGLESEPKKVNKKKANKAEEEDLDSLLAEFGVEPKSTKSKKTKRK
jgi:DnaJ family protein C protein 2